MAESVPGKPRWYPEGTRDSATPPPVGSIIAWAHAAWRVTEINPIPEDLWTEQERRTAKAYKPEVGTPAMVVVRPVHITDDDVRVHDHDKHLRHRGGLWWRVYPSEHYPVCARCLEPLPCRDQLAQAEVEKSVRTLELYLQTGDCPACAQQITPRQKTTTFEENIVVPGGPPISFHVGRRDCRYAAAQYEKKWVALAPGERSTTWSCPGAVTNHGDGTYECTEEDQCRGPLAFHPQYSSCEDRECRAQGPVDSHPWPDAKRRQGETSC